VSRNLSVSSQLRDELNFAGVGLFTIQYGEMNKMLVGAIEAVSDQFSSDLRDKVKRGQKGRVLNGKVAGGVGYG